jgi:DNA-binding NarL/FixJ family response regulator
MKTITIVLADDHAILREGLASLINGQKDMQVVAAAENGLELLEQCKKEQPDVAVIDISMPKCTGLEALEELVSKCPNTRVLVLTMHDNQTYARKVLASGGSGYIVKKTAGKELIKAIREVHAGRSYLQVSLSDSGLSDLVDEPKNALNPHELLSPRELQVLKLLALGYTNKEVASELEIATKSVDTYRVRLQEKLELKGRASLVRYALDAGLLQPRIP